MENGHFRLDDFELYKIAREFRKRTYRLVKQLPAEEKYALASQMRRAAVSVTNNIAEGHGRWHYQENIRFCRISRGSVDELIDDFNTCEDEGYGDQALVAELNNPNIWWRMTAQRLLLERQDKKAAPLLAKSAENEKTPETRVHALRALEGLGCLTDAQIKRALNDKHPAVREHAIQLADPRASFSPALAARLLLSRHKQSCPRRHS